MSAVDPVIHDFGTDKKRIRARARKKAKNNRLPGTRDNPPVLVFEAEQGSAEANMPPVRIFLGTEPLQYKAERIFAWSVAKHRNPSRRYEIYLMKDLSGYDRGGWATGFTKYRFAIPQLAGGTGRAIYNDVDQVYLSDPAELFDFDMGDAGLLAIDDEETSVMLMDCDKLARLWEMDTSEGSAPSPGNPEMVREAGLWGLMPGVWNSRDTEYVAGESKLLHFTTLYKQPWRPFPEVYDYDVNENEQVWLDLEAEANVARFFPFSREKPSARFEGLLGQGAAKNASSASNAQNDCTGDVAKLIEQYGVKTLLDYRFATTEDPQLNWPNVDVEQHSLIGALSSAETQYDAVVARDLLESVPEEDVLWVLNDLFQRARSLVYVHVACYPVDGESASGTVLPPEWWHGQMELIGAMYPQTAWELHTPTSPGQSLVKATIRSVFGATERFSSAAP